MKTIDLWINGTSQPARSAEYFDDINPATGKPITSQSASEMVDQILEMGEGTRLYIMAPIVRGRKGEYKKSIEYGIWSLEVCENIGDKSMVGITLGDIGNSYRKNGDLKPIE